MSTLASYVPLRRSTSPMSTVTASSFGEREDDMAGYNLSQSMSSFRSTEHSGPDHSHSLCESCGDLERDFAAAVLFVDSYQGPHRILTQENSGPKKDFYAYYQQATVGPCPNSSQAQGLSGIEAAKWDKWRQLGDMTKHEAMKRYTSTLDNLVDGWRRSARNTTVSRSRNGDNNSSNPALKKSVSMFERLPHLYEEIGSIESRLEDESHKRQLLETQFHNVSSVHEAAMDDHSHRLMDTEEAFKTLMEDMEAKVSEQARELESLSATNRELSDQIDNSIILSSEKKVAGAGKKAWGLIMQPTVWKTVLVVVAFQLYVYGKRRRVPQKLAQYLVQWLLKISQSE